MRHRGLAVAGIGVAVAVAAGGAYAYIWDRGHSDVIAKGVHVAGIDVGGLHASDARALVGRELGTRLSAPVYLLYGRRSFTVRPTSVGMRVDVAGMVDAAVAASRRGGILHRLWRDARGQRLDMSIPLRAGLSGAGLAAASARVARALDVEPKDASVTPNPLATGLVVIRSKTGLAVKRAQLEQRLANATLRLDGRRAVSVPTRPVYPRWQTSTLTAKYGTYILVSRETFTLRLYKDLRLARSYRIAVGRQGLETPAGLYSIDDKQVNPSWHVPLSSWAGDLAGRVIPPGPEDPIKARWMGFYNGAGIHGTDELSSIGTAASHGCIRMTIPDVEQLYDLVPLHTPIYVG